MIVLDSSFLIAYRNERDAHHDRATGTMERLLGGAWGPALLPEYVMVEVATVLASRRGITAAARAAQELLEMRELEFVPCSDVFLEALSTFSSQARTRLSLTDAALVAIARRRGASHIATFDADFRKVTGLGVVPR